MMQPWAAHGGIGRCGRGGALMLIDLFLRFRDFVECGTLAKVFLGSHWRCLVGQCNYLCFEPAPSPWFILTVIQADCKTVTITIQGTLH